MRSILLHVHDDAALESRLQAAFDLARAFGGHITCVHATPFEEYLATDPLVVSMLPTEFSRKMKRKLREVQARVEARIKAEGLTWDWIHVDEQMSSALIVHSPFADVVVVSLTPPTVLRDDPRPLGAAVALGGRAPVLAVPAACQGLRLDRPVILAWNGSPEAAAAMRAGLPVFRQAPQVILLEVSAVAWPYPRDRAARYLSRHDVHVEIAERAPIDGSVSGAIVAAARETGAGTIAMGAYGRSRLREFLLGGVTRDLLAESEFPLLLAH